VIVPALRGAGLSRVDLMVLTHQEADHVGGAVSVLESLQVEAIASSLAAEHPLNALAAVRRRCRAGERWRWDGVRFEFLHPPAAAREARRNNQSCVLRIETAGGSILLTGDIERQVEMQLVSSPVDVLLVPHHGSRSSSSPEFITALKPRYAIVPVGYRSRFGHPAPEVLHRYHAAGARLFRTDAEGAATVHLGDSVLSVELERRRRGRYWLQ
jgi:competence protein ComEC